jgi:hypothetical protein
MVHSTAASGKKKQTHVRRLRHVLYLMNCGWQYNGAACVTYCSFAIKLLHWHLQLRPKRFCVLQMRSHLAWSLWHITEMPVLNISEGHWISWDYSQFFSFSVQVNAGVHCVVLRQVNGLFQSEFSRECDLRLPFFQIPNLLSSSRSTNSCLRLLLRLLFPSIFNSIQRCRT